MNEAETRAELIDPKLKACGLDQEKLPVLLTNKYRSLEDAKDVLGDVANISKLFIEFQQHLYKHKAA